MKSVDPKAEKYGGMSPYCSMGNNPVSFSDPDGDAFFALLAYSGFGVLTNGALNAASGENFFKGALGAAVRSAFSVGVDYATLGEIVNRLPAANINFGGGFNLSISPSIALGRVGDFGLGVNAAVNYQSGNFNFGVGGGLTYGKSGVTGNTSLERRFSVAGAYQSGNFGVSVSSTNFSSGETSQRVGTIGIRSGDFNFVYDNDNIPGIGDLVDRFRTSAVRVSYRDDFHVGLNMFTGDPSADLYRTTEVNGIETYDGPAADKYRLGALYFGYQNTRAGFNSESIRNIFQNHLVHTGIAKPFGGVPHFRKLDNRWQLYGGVYSKNPYTLW